MTLDSEAKRRRAIATYRGRLPWMRRFRTPKPDGTIDAIDRAQLGGAYYEGGEPSIMTSPYLTVYNYIWQLLETEPILAAGVPKGNIVDFRNLGALKLEMTTADFPMLVVADSASDQNTTLNSSTTIETITYQVGVLAGGDRVTDGFYDISWGVFMALTRFSRTVLSVLHEGKQFIADAAFGEPTEIDLGESFEPYFKGGNLAWAKIYNFDVVMQFTTAQLAGV